MLTSAKPTVAICAVRTGSGKSQTTRHVAALLRELWAEGQKPTADELLKEIAGAELEMSAVHDRVREALR